MKCDRLCARPLPPPGGLVFALFVPNLQILGGEGSAAGGWRGQVFLGCDNHPLTFQEMMDACTASGCFPPCVVEFTGTAEAGGAGKRVNNDASRARLGGWRPQYDSFQAFFQAGGQDYYNSKVH